MDCSLGWFYHHNRESGSVAAATHKLKSFTSRVNSFFPGFGCHLSNWGFTFEQAGLAYLQGLAICISGHHCHLSAPVRDIQYHYWSQYEYECRITKIPVWFLKSPDCFTSSTTWDLPLMTDITKHVRRLMLKDSRTGEGQSWPAWGV